MELSENKLPLSDFESRKLKNLQEYKDALIVAAQKNYPRHVAIIMDGNGRWAKMRHRPRQWGHVRGSERVREIIRKAGKLGLESLTLFCFSTENWKRNEVEIRTLMKLLKKHLLDSKDLEENNAEVHAIGEIHKLPPDVQQTLFDLTKRTKNNQGLKVNFCISYGSRQEILSAVQKIAEEVKNGLINTDQITEEYISSKLLTSHLKDPDLIIRTSGEYRISNFLLWQAAYSELYITDTLWPDFRATDFEKAILDYTQRQRRFGGST